MGLSGRFGSVWRVAVPALLLGIFALPQTGRSQASNEVTLEFLLVDSSGQAGEILQRLQNGEDFAALAHKYSNDPSAAEGGYLGTVNPDELRLELRDAIKGLQPGQFSKIAQLPNGYAILRVLQKEERPETKDDDPSRLLAIEAQASARFTADTSGYQEVTQAIRISIPSPKWGLDLKEVCEARQNVPEIAIAGLRRDLEAGRANANDQATMHYDIGELFSARANIDAALEEWQQAYQIATSAGIKELSQSLEETIGTGYLRRAELPNPSKKKLINKTHLMPEHPGPEEPDTADLEKAISYLTKFLAHDNTNTEIRWLLNLAYMMQGTYPVGVPKEILIPPSVFESKEDVGRFVDIAPAAGVDVFGTAGGGIADDFDNDGLLDIVTSQMDDCAPLHFFHNNGDGTFSDRTAQAGLADQMGGLNVIQGDYNNDGCTDLLVLRGGWEFPRRRSLLRNNCDGTFTDVTFESGLAEPMRSSQTAVWTDIDNDGRLDLFIGNENAPAQLFLNQGDGTFIDIGKEAGVARSAFTKAVAAGDYDNDGYPDLYVSNSNGYSFLYHNNGDRTFTEVSAQAGVKANRFSFGAWFFDYDNDGWPDLFATCYYSSAEESARSYLGLPRKGETLKLFKNMQNGTFKDVTAEVGLDRVLLPMGSNFGDIDNDGYLDIYLGVGNPSFATVFPNTLFRNQAGRHFVDVSTSSGMAAISKGHGVAFADFGNSGNEDIFIVMGGASIGDRNNARLFQNPGHGNDWITLKLVGEKSNRGGIGARIAATVVNEGKAARTIYKTVGTGGSFGGSPIQQHIGLGKSATIEKIEVTWPASKTKQTFTGIQPNQFLEIKESANAPTKLERKSFNIGAAAHE